MAPSTEHSFARFRATRDARYLAAVFDRTALDLLAVAEHLVTELADAEDLVQSTFLAAIESAERFRDGEAVLPWLTGILYNLARQHRARQRRCAPPQRIARRAIQAPSEAAASRELSDSVRSALRGVPQPYRDVVRLRLDGLTTSAIAARLKRPPGTVRAQLSRGMAMLRRVLPAGVAGGAVLDTTLAGVRESVLAAATSAVAPGAAAGAVIGGATIVKSKLVAGAIVVSLLISLLIVRVSQDDPPPPAAGDHQLAQPASLTSANEASPASGNPPTELREAVATPAAVPHPFLDPAAEAPRPDVLRIEAIDASGRPAPGATVIVGRDGARLSIDNPEPVSAPTDPMTALLYKQAEMQTYRGWNADATGTGILEATCDHNGRAELRIGPGHKELLVVHTTAGTSGQQRIHQERRNAENPWRIVLYRLPPLRGIVLDSAGNGLPDAEVSARHGPNIRGRLERVAGVTNTRGEFALPIDKVGRYRVYARAEHAGSDQTDAFVAEDGTSAPIELRMPGAFAIIGAVVTPDGASPESAEVRVWRLVDDLEQDTFPFTTARNTDASGRFSVPLSRGGRYRIVARSNGFANSTWRDLEVTESRTPVELRLHRWTTIRGRISGSGARADVSVVASHEGRRDRYGMYLFSLYGEGDFVETRTSADGSFLLEGVHPDASYTVTAFLDPGRYRLVLTQHDVQAGTSSLELIAKSEDLTSARLHGRVVSGITGRPISQFQVRLWKYYDRGPAYPENAVDQRDGDGTFVIDHLAVGGDYSIVVRSPGFAPRHVPRWRMTDERREITVELLEFGSIELTVLDGAGQPRANAPVVIESLSENPENEPRRARTDGAGRICTKLGAGRYRARNGQAAAEFEVRPSQRTFAELRTP